MRPVLLLPALLLSTSPAVFAAPRVDVGYAREGGEKFELKGVPPPTWGDAATKATFIVIDGEIHGGKPKLRALHDGILPASIDDPGENFFFVNKEGARRLLIDLGQPVDVQEFNSYSWHPGARAPQVYRLYAAAGTESGFEAQPHAPADPAKSGWTLVADVDTRAKAGGGKGGQYGVSVSAPAGLGKFRYLLMDVVPTNPQNPESDTFFSEIDVVDRAAAAAKPRQARPNPTLDRYKTRDGKAVFTILYDDAPDLQEWGRKELAPVMQEWYPRIAELLKSPGYTAPDRFTIKFTNDYEGVAVTMGTLVLGDPRWYRTSLDTEAVGSMVHELVHVIQRYWSSRGRGERKPTPTWVSEGIADYVRWEIYEPKPRFRVTAENVGKIRYDESYQTTADFLRWVSEKYDRQLVPKLNQVAREGRYDESFWKTVTGKTAPELGEEWRQAHAKKLGVKLDPSTP